MIRRESRQVGIADAFVRPPNSEHILDKINHLVNWEPLRRKMEGFYTSGGPGRPAFPVVVLFKALLLQNWHNLSDPATEEAIDDRLSFRRFLGLNMDEKSPDHSTLHRFRDRIAPVMDELFQMVNAQLAAHQLMVKQGTIVDATLIRSQARQPPKGNSDSDPDARWGRKKNALTFGYKGHVGMDQHSELIRQADLTPANVHDAGRFEAMVSGDEAMVYTDKGYHGRRRSRWLQERGIGDGIMAKGCRWQPEISREQAARNRAISKVRSGVERVFGTLKRIYRYGRCRYYNLWRNRCNFLVLCICYNLRRAVKLCEGRAS